MTRKIENFGERLDNLESAVEFKETIPFAETTLTANEPSWGEILPEPLTSDQKRDKEWSEYLYRTQMRKWYVRWSHFAGSMLALIIPQIYIQTTWIAVSVSTGLVGLVLLGVPLAMYMWYRRGQDFV